jgi:hypothetical protein
MNILFLDFNGVLDRIESWPLSPDEYEGLRTGPDDKVPPRLLRLELLPECVRILNDVLERTGALVVLSTSWRNWPDQDYVRERLATAGFTGDIIGSTPGYLGPRMTRGDEIQAWLDEHPGDVEAFAILDDCDDMFSLHDHLVLVNPMTGLTESYVPRLLELLTPLASER